MMDPFAQMDAVIVSAIGDPIVYRPNGGAAVMPPIKAFVDHSQDTINFNLTGGTVYDASLQVRVADVANPSKADLVELPAVGRTFAVREIARDPSGMWWNMRLKLHHDQGAA